MGLVASGQRFSEASDAEIKTAIQAALNRQNLKVVDLNVARVDQPAPNIVVETEDPQEAARSALSLISSLFFNQDHQPTYEGYYFEVVDATGSPVLIQAASFRTGAGHLWFRPDVANALSLPHL